LAIGEGVRLHAGHIALCAMLGQQSVRVAGKPVVTILCTGDELRPVGTTLQDAQIFESNSAALAALAEQACATVRVAPGVKDEPAALAAALTQALEGTDLLLTVGGVSVGDHDLVRPMLEQVGVQLDFWKVAIKPGKPLAVGRSDKAVVLGLPGNPASALVTFALFGMPLLRAMQGDKNAIAAPLRVGLAQTVEHATGRLEFARAQIAAIDGQWQASVHTNQSSGAATSLAWCNGLVALSSEVRRFEAGTVIDAWRFADL
jgi:molybdopterin molybdotransferase